MDLGAAALRRQCHGCRQALGLPAERSQAGRIARGRRFNARAAPDDRQRPVTVRVGTSGWSYDHWVGVLYPPGLPPARRLARYAEVFDTVELNASFYRWPKDSTFTGWRDQLPDGFTMSVKAHRGLTHYRRLARTGTVDRTVRTLLAAAG